ncbi:glycosyltransferase family 2 protein [Methanobrevibacter sp.]|uniref:glycosyltransferase family 2 protein n=1 Tax=Methanobrevibacter sp. TaxID=66852 RepID=UPI003868F587
MERLFLVKISVIVPVYNTEKYLRECLDSVVNQTFRDIEIICINDGSTDSSLDILNEYEKLDDRISVFSQDNSGLSITRNNGMKISKGKYIYFMDSDDYLELTAFEELYTISERDDLDLLVFKLMNFDDETGEKYTSEYYEMESLKDWYGKIFNFSEIGANVLNFAVSASGKFFKKDLIKDLTFPENLIFEDNLFFANALIKAKKVSIYDKHLYNRRIRSNSITTTKTIKFADSIIILNRIISLAKEVGVYEELKVGLAQKKIDLGLIRYSDVGLEFKEEFFTKLNHDFKDFEEEYERDILDKLDNRYRYIFRSFIFSKSHMEFDLKIEIFNIKNENKRLEKENKKLIKKITKLKNKKNDILTSKAR